FRICPQASSISVLLFPIARNITTPSFAFENETTAFFPASLKVISSFPFVFRSDNLLLNFIKRGSVSSPTKNADKKVWYLSKLEGELGMCEAGSKENLSTTFNFPSTFIRSSVFRPLNLNFSPASLLPDEYQSSRKRSEFFSRFHSCF